MEWIPSSGWLTKIAVDAAAGDLTYDLAIDVTGAGAPSRVDAGFELPGVKAVVDTFDARRFVLAIGFALMGIAGIWLVGRSRPGATLR